MLGNVASSVEDEENHLLKECEQDKGMAVDPVCGMRVDERTSKLKSEHEGKTFYFCSASCKNTFDKDPHKYGHPR